MYSESEINDRVAELKAYSAEQDASTAVLFVPLETALSSYFSASDLTEALRDVVKYMYNDIQRRTTVYETEWPDNLPTDFPTGYYDLRGCFYDFSQLMTITDAAFYAGFVFAASPEGGSAVSSNTYLDAWTAGITSAASTEGSAVASGKIVALVASLVGGCISSEIAATSIKNLILVMASGTSATNTQRSAFASLGLATEKLAQRMQVDAKRAIIDVLERVSQLDQASQAATLQQLFGKESLGAMDPFLSNLDRRKENFDRVSDAAQYAGSMEGEFADRAATTENSLQLMQNRIAATAFVIGNGMIPTLFIAFLREVAKGVKALENSRPAPFSKFPKNVRFMRFLDTGGKYVYY